LRRDEANAVGFISFSFGLFAAKAHVSHEKGKAAPLVGCCLMLFVI